MDEARLTETPLFEGAPAPAAVTTTTITSAPPTASPGPVVFEGEAVLGRAAELKAAFDALFEEGEALDPVEFDLSRVSEIDVAGIQLLLAAERTARACQRPLRLVAPSRPVRRAAELLHLTLPFVAEALRPLPSSVTASESMAATESKHATEAPDGR